MNLTLISQFIPAYPLKKSETPLQIAHRVLEIEKAALEKLRVSLDDSFNKVVQMLISLNGRVVVSGVGKSALIAQKWVASFNSTGTPALFMHAADAVHGDLGMIQKGDLVFILSKSGTSEEISTLSTYLKRLGHKFVAVTANAQSVLYKEADLSLLTPVEKEACPHDLAPTSSTTLQLALGDALMVATLETRGFGADEFAKFHPGGSLGKKLTLTVADLIQNNAQPKVSGSSSLKETIMVISKNLLGCTAVCEQDRVIGMITDGDLRRMLEQHSNYDQISAKDVMSSSPKTIEKNQLASEALELMNRHEITQLVVTENHKYLGILHLHNLIQAGIA